MDNISFPKNMAGWSQRETKPVAPSESNDAVAYDKAPDENELNFDIMLNHSILLTERAFDEAGHCYDIKARKELHDARIHLAMAKDLLKRLK